MQVIDIVNNNEVKDLEHCVACIGYFDGLHQGHLALIEKTLEIAKATHTLSALITFDPDPWSVIHQEAVQHITTIEDRKEICERLGFDILFILKFDAAFSQVEPHDFIKILYLQYQIRHLVCGFDFKYGKFGKGNTESLLSEKCSDFDVTVINEVSSMNEKISSSQIIGFIKDGAMEKVTSLLNRPYRIAGKVVSGSQIGRKLGFPTANLEFSEEYVIPKIGVYFGFTRVDNKIYPSMINVGYNPTTNKLSSISIESYLLDFNDDLYGKNIYVDFTHYHRGELALSSLEELIEVMKNDEVIARCYFEQNGNEMIG